MKSREENYPIFTEEMKKTHKILMPMMLEPHFSLLCEVLRDEGYDIELLRTNHSSIAEEGLKYTHNDMCYPAILVIGQFIDALKSGKYDTHRTALIITQTGGGCRASNYIHLLRKALKSSGYEYVPVISASASNLEKHEGFKLSINAIYKCMNVLLYGDFLLCIYNQARSHEVVKGESAQALQESVEFLKATMKTGSLGKRKENYMYILEKFNNIALYDKVKPRVGIVGEIYMKYSALGNNKLEEFLIEEGAEPVVSGFIDFLLYCISNSQSDRVLYNIKSKYEIGRRAFIDYVIKKQREMINVIENNSRFIAPGDFKEIYNAADGIINKGVKMGEGWLLTAEMVSHIKNDVNNIVCAQPFGCLPNHIVARGVMGKIRKEYPKANILAIDYDPGASKTNQENRLKLMLMNATYNEKSEDVFNDYIEKKKRQDEKFVEVEESYAWNR